MNDFPDLLLRLGLASPLAQGPHQDRAGVAVQRVLPQHVAEPLFGGREVALPEQRPAQVEREVVRARLQIQRLAQDL